MSDTTTPATSPEIDKLAAALSKAQGEFELIIKDRTNPFFSSKYATIDALQTATRAALAANGLAIVQIVQSGARLELSTRLLHASGQWIASTVPLHQIAAGPQKFGSELTYLRRYSYAGMLSIAADEDDDANAASSTAAPATTTRTAPKTAAATKPPASTAAAQDEDKARIWVNALLRKMEAVTTEEAMRELMDPAPPKGSPKGTISAMKKNLDGLRQNRANLYAEIEEAGTAMLERIGRTLHGTTTEINDDDRAEA